jgi:hypothetical protein
MSRKINLSINGKVRPNLGAIFKSYISRKFSEYELRTKRYYKLFPFLLQWGIEPEDAEAILFYYGYIDKDGDPIVNATNSDIWDEEDYWDEYEEIYPGVNNSNYLDGHWDDLEKTCKKKGHGGKYKHTKGKKNKEGMYSVTDRSSQGSVDDADKYYIYYYPDYRDKTDRLEFNTLKEFDDFCAKNEFCVPPYTGERVAYRPVSHCCLNPGLLERGISEILGSESYGDMFYEACEELEVNYR